VLLAPTVNIHRSVTNGRNFECYSEDPILTALLCGAYIEGLQGQGVAATLKHYVGNESEIERQTISSQIDERTLRELYLVPFEHAVKVAGTWGIMSSYNKLNGTFTSEHRWLLDTVLRGEWKYDGIVMSDWFGSHSTVPTMTAGLDIEMPGPPRDRGAKLVEAVNGSEVPRTLVEARALNVLRLMVRTGAIDDETPHEEVADDRPAHRSLIRRAAAEGMVLLKNSEGLLPLDAQRIGSIAVIGPNARVARIMGGGSAQLNPHYAVSPWEGLARFFGEDRLRFAQGAENDRYQPLLRGQFAAHYFNNADLTGDAVDGAPLAAADFFIGGPPAPGVKPSGWSARFSGAIAPETSGTYRLGVFSTGLARVRVDGKIVADAWSRWRAGGTYFGLGCDEVVGSIELVAGRSYRVDFEVASRPEVPFTAGRVGLGLPLPASAVDAAVAIAKEADVAIVCVGRTGEWDTEGGDLPDIRLPGRQDELVSAVAAANPRTIVLLQTGGPVEMPWIDEVPAVLQAWYPGQEAGNAIAEVLGGALEPGGRLPQSFPIHWNDNPAHSQDREVYPGLDGKVRYEEGVFVGYRHYDRHGVVPLFPFGFGLGYTSFDLGDLAIDASRFEAEGAVDVLVSVTNTGARRGSEVVQLYVGDEASSVPRPVKELKAFAKVELDAGATERIRLGLTARDFAFFDVGGQNWVVEPGSFSLLVGTSAAAIALRAQISRSGRLELAV
jgi:beta-glucosidase